MYNSDSTTKCDILNVLPAPPVSVVKGDAPAVIVTSIHWARSFGPAALLVTYRSHGVVIWDAMTANTLRVYPIPSLVASASLSVDEKLLVVSNHRNGFDIYNLGYSGKVRTLEFKAVGQQRATSVAFLRGGRVVLSGSLRGNCGLWQLDEEIPMQVLDHHEKTEIFTLAEYYDLDNDICLFATGTHRAPGTEGTVINLWKVKASYRKRVAELGLRFFWCAAVILTTALAIYVSLYIARSREDISKID
ncbi:hypothetical protein NLJ89_g9848 [Agrocybe chaxingu]|uniref:Uncharacterized protein n=1 Tax=Agrocybe chaxingu TaxID=84603 RepID=A0A9W8MSP3_9AGAR|nr:hypothetical protein NLJ89_g9848 [Agrocybe chaxingu]